MSLTMYLGMLDKNIIITMVACGICFDSYGLLEFALGQFQRGRQDANSNKLWESNNCQWLPYRTPCRFFIYNILFGPEGLHLLLWSELWWSLLFRPMRALSFQWSRGLHSRVWSGPKSQVTWGKYVQSQPLRAWKLGFTTSHKLSSLKSQVGHGCLHGNILLEARLGTWLESWVEQRVGHDSQHKSCK